MYAYSSERWQIKNQPFQFSVSLRNTFVQKDVCFQSPFHGYNECCYPLDSNLMENQYTVNRKRIGPDAFI